MPKRMTKRMRMTEEMMLGLKDFFTGVRVSSNNNRNSPNNSYFGTSNGIME